MKILEYKDEVRIKEVKKLRDEANQLEREATRSLPLKWKKGLRVRFLRDQDWAWSKGTEATVVALDKDYKGKLGNEYQVFWTEPDDGRAMWWTTPNDVELVMPQPPQKATKKKHMTQPEDKP